MKQVLKTVRLGVAILSVSVLATGCANALELPDAKAKFQQKYNRVPVESFDKSAIPGIYEIVTGDKVIYYAPDEDILVFGEMWRDGKSLTGEKKNALMAKKTQLLVANKDKALKIGSGPKEVIEITDPDCPYCRTAHKYLDSRKDITRYVFFLPLDFHKNAPAKIKYILGAKDADKAMHDVYAGKFDNTPVPTDESEASNKRMLEMKKLAGQAGVTGTPAFIVDGQVVHGADIQRLEKLLGPAQ